MINYQIIINDQLSTTTTIDQTGNALVVGEWGGMYNPGTPDEQYENTLSAWLISNGFQSNFYW